MKHRNTKIHTKDTLTDVPPPLLIHRLEEFKAQILISVYRIIVAVFSSLKFSNSKSPDGIFKSSQKSQKLPCPLQLQLESGSGQEAPLTGVRGKVFIQKRETKQGTYLIGCSLSGCIVWEILVGYLIAFLPNLEALIGTDSGLGFGLLW